MATVQDISIYQNSLKSIAYNMLGSMADAEDAVHDAFVKWFTIDTSKIENVKAYLVRMVTNICLNIIKSRKDRQNLHIDAVHDTLEDRDVEEDLNHFDLENQLNEAWRYIHRKLEPIEQAIYVLREGFNVEYEDLQLIFDRKAENCRKIVSRAKSKLNNTDFKSIPKSFSQMHLLESIKNASRKGHIAQLISDFTSETFNKKK
ncbi:sigma-70 family RNA polymerase sigma factor [Hyphobacterium sp. CCMP332]|nr:sigma-70 family RNA polymerase sigma factor [Hyphobacterium sp. CCMP332]